jgi:hypothetical protein
LLEEALAVYQPSFLLTLPVDVQPLELKTKQFYHFCPKQGQVDWVMEEVRTLIYIEKIYKNPLLNQW